MVLKADVDVQEQDILAFLLMGNGISVFYRFSAAIRMKTAGEMLS
jgi:hypothetical protein